MYSHDPSNRNKTVVVIENDAAVINLLSRILSMNHFKILTADNSNTGLTMAESVDPDLIFVNTDLLGLDGVSFLHSLQFQSDINRIPIIALGDDIAPNAKVTALENGFDAYMAKPFDSASINEIIRNFFTIGDPTDTAALSKVSKAARILIVDDEPNNLKLLKAYLATENYEIFTATSGQEAITKACQIPPDVILLDIMMPGIDGFEVTLRLKGNPDTKNIPIILVTALSGEKSRARGLQVGADEFLTKPVHRAELVARVSSMLRLKRFQDQLHSRQKSQGRMDVKNDNPFSKAEYIPSILIVEDDDRDARLLLNYLDSEPYMVRRSINGELAIRDSLEAEPDLIILDILLPGIDGFEVCRRVKCDDRLRHTQVLLLTSLRELDYRIQGTELGADDYLVKPVEPRELLARVQALLKKKRYIDKLNYRYETAINRAIHDGLTGLYNHDYFKRFFTFEIKRSLRQLHSISLLLIDLDNFKQINDCLGHQAGDQFLIKTGKIIRDSVREVDFVARYGGEEFVVILPYVNDLEARDIAERIRLGIEKMADKEVLTKIQSPVTASIGIAFCPDDSSEAEIIVRKADEMMYLAKQLGKNQVCSTSDF